MCILHVFKIVRMLPNRAKRHIWSLLSFVFLYRLQWITKNTEILVVPSLKGWRFIDFICFFNQPIEKVNSCVCTFQIFVLLFFGEKFIALLCFVLNNYLCIHFRSYLKTSNFLSKFCFLQEMFLMDIFRYYYKFWKRITENCIESEAVTVFL